MSVSKQGKKWEIYFQMLQPVTKSSSLDSDTWNFVHLDVVFNWVVFFFVFRTCVIIWWCFKQKYRKILQVYLIRGTRMCRRKCTEEHKKHDFLFFSINIIINQPSLSGFHLQSNLVQLETLTLAVSVCPAWSFSRSGHFCLMRSSISW